MHISNLSIGSLITCECITMTLFVYNEVRTDALTSLMLESYI